MADEETKPAMNKKTFVAVLIAASLICTVLVGFLARGCAGPSREEKIDLFSGTWELVKRKGSNSGAEADTVEALARHDLYVRLVLNRDGTGSFDLLGKPMDLTWKTRWGTTGRIYLDGEKAKMRIDSEGMLVLEDRRQSLTFKKLAEAEPAAEDEAEASSDGDESTEE